MATQKLTDKLVNLKKPSNEGRAECCDTVVAGFSSLRLMNPLSIHGRSWRMACRLPCKDRSVVEASVATNTATKLSAGHDRRLGSAVSLDESGIICRW